MDYVVNKYRSPRFRIATNCFNNRGRGYVTHRLFVTNRFDDRNQLDEFLQTVKRQGFLVVSQRETIKRNRNKRNHHPNNDNGNHNQ